MPNKLPGNNATLHLHLEVEYELNGVSVEYLKKELEKAPSLLVASGLLSGDSPAQVSNFYFKVTNNGPQ